MKAVVEAMVRRLLAAALRRAADELAPQPAVSADQPAAASAPASLVPSSERAEADALAAMLTKLGHMRFERYLRQALRRYSPHEQPAEA